METHDLNLFKKRKPSPVENKSARKKKVHVLNSYSSQKTIECLPKEVLLKIFHYLPLNDLLRIARVNKLWNELSKNPSLWKKLCVSFQWQNGSQNKIFSEISQNLPSSLTYLKLDFRYGNWKECLKFQEFCVEIGKKCSDLKVLIFDHAQFSVSLQAAINLCSHYFQNLEVLAFYFSSFTNYNVGRECDVLYKIKRLDLVSILGVEIYRKLHFPKMPKLKKISLVHACVKDSWFEDDVSFLENLELLNLHGAFSIGSRTFQTLKKHALKLIELYFCGTRVKDSDLNFRMSVFPKLKTICLYDCKNVTCEGIVSLIRSCPSLQTVYVTKQIANSYEEHPFIVSNENKLEIVKGTETCYHYLPSYRD